MSTAMMSPAIQLDGEDLLAARRVLRNAIVEAVWFSATDDSRFEDVARLPRLGELVDGPMGRVGYPLPHRTNDGRLTPEHAALLAEVARLEARLGDDMAMNSWDAMDPAESASVEMESTRAADARQVLTALEAAAA